MQVINHAWSRKLNQDIIAPVAAAAGGARTNGDAAPQQTRPLPCWDWLLAAAQRSVADAQKAWAAAEGQGVFVTHGWSLPYPYQDVKRVRPAAACRLALAYGAWPHTPLFYLLSQLSMCPHVNRMVRTEYGNVLGTGRRPTLYRLL